ncbi:MAG: hypothetical protein ABWY57_00870, partial [Mycetocola sp.]
MTRKRFLLALVVASSAVVAIWIAAASAGASTAGGRQLPIAGTGSPQTGAFTPSGSTDATSVEFPGQLDEGEGSDGYPGTIVNRSFSRGASNGVSA